MAGQTDLRFRDPERAEALAAGIRWLAASIDRDPITILHVCGSHEQAIARFGLRTALPPNLEVIVEPGCPGIIDLPEVDEAVALSLQGVKVCVYGDMLRVPGSSLSLADARARGGDVAAVYGPTQAIEIARSTKRDVVFFATGFETTAVITAAALLDDPPDNFSVLAAHPFTPRAMERVCRTPGSHVEAFLAAGHAAAITGSRIFEPVAERHGTPIVIAGFEPLDILAAVHEALVLVRDGRNEVSNLDRRCVTEEGNVPALELLWLVFEEEPGWRRGSAGIPDGKLRLRPSFARWDARRRHRAALGSPADERADELGKRLRPALEGEPMPRLC